MLTRPAGRNEALAQPLRDAGWQTLALPALALEPLPDTPPAPLPGDFDLVVFVSGNAARLYMERIAPRLPRGWPAGARAACVGPASARALQAMPGWPAGAAVLQPAADALTHDSEALWAELAQHPLPQRVLLVRGEQGRDWLAARLKAAGAQVVEFAVYRRGPAAWPSGAAAALNQLVQAGEPAVWLLTSGEGIDALAAGLRARGLLDWWRQCGFVVTHPRLADHLQAFLGAPPLARITITTPTDDAVLKAMHTALTIAT